MYKDPADPQRDAGQEAIFSGICEYAIRLHALFINQTCIFSGRKSLRLVHMKRFNQVKVFKSLQGV